MSTVSAGLKLASPSTEQSGICARDLSRLELHCSTARRTMEVRSSLSLRHPVLKAEAPLLEATAAVNLSHDARPSIFVPSVGLLELIWRQLTKILSWRTVFNVFCKPLR